MTAPPCRPSSPRINLSDDLACGVCGEVLLEPLSLPCGHSFAGLCITTWLASSSTPTCPICRAETHSTLSPSYHLSTVSEAYFKACMTELRRGGLSTLAEGQEAEREDRRRLWISLRSNRRHSSSPRLNSSNRLACFASIADSLASPTFGRQPWHATHSEILEASAEEESRRDLAMWERIARRDRREDERWEMERRALEDRLASTELALGRLQLEVQRLRRDREPPARRRSPVPRLDLSSANADSVSPPPYQSTPPSPLSFLRKPSQHLQSTYSPSPTTLGLPPLTPPPTHIRSPPGSPRFSHPFAPRAPSRLPPSPSPISLNTFIPPSFTPVSSSPRMPDSPTRRASWSRRAFPVLGTRERDRWGPHDATASGRNCA